MLGEFKLAKFWFLTNEISGEYNLHCIPRFLFQNSCLYKISNRYWGKRMKLSDISVHTVKESINFWFRFNQETFRLCHQYFHCMKKPNNKLWSRKEEKNTYMNWIMRKVIIQKPVYSFCFGDQGEFLRSKIFTETRKVFLLTEIP